MNQFTTNNWFGNNNIVSLYIYNKNINAFTKREMNFLHFSYLKFVILYAIKIKNHLIAPKRSLNIFLLSWHGLLRVLAASPV